MQTQQRGRGGVEPVGLPPRTAAETKAISRKRIRAGWRFTGDAEKAAHESAHAVVGRALGLEPTLATLRPNERSLARVEFVDSCTDWKAGIKMRYAGEIAQRRLLGPHLAQSHYGDGDRKAARELAEENSSDPDYWLETLAQATEALVDGHWPVIEEVAAELIVERELSGGDLSRIINLATIAQLKAKYTNN